MSKTATKPKKPAAKDKAAGERLVPIFVMGKRYEVPDSLTIQKALEYAGYMLVRGCGCRGVASVIAKHPGPPVYAVL